VITIQTNKYVPYMSIVGFSLFIFTVLINGSFMMASDPGWKTIFSIFGVLMLVVTIKLHIGTSCITDAHLRQ